MTGRDRGAATPELQLAVLQAVTAVARGDVHTAEGLRLDHSIGYDLCQLLTSVEGAGIASEEELAQIEWIWLPALVNSRQGPTNLYRLLVREPASFVQVVRVLYRKRPEMHRALKQGRLRLAEELETKS